MIRYKVSENGRKLYYRFKKINDTSIEIVDNNKDILREIQISWEWEKVYIFEILKEIIDGNDKKIKSYGFTMEDLKYAFKYPAMVWVNMEKYFERVD
jgi:hypothetical protein